ncbi:MAG: beta-galactosidase [bacterium]|jgi:hypothetical protein|nr:beta-galactosidase [bacterium]
MFRYGPGSIILLLLFTTSVAASPYRVAVFADPAFPVAPSHTPVAAVMDVLSQAGMEGVPLTADQIMDPTQFNADRFDLMITANGPAYPMDGNDALLAFLRRGGDLLCAGGYAFDDPLVRRDGQWISARMLWEEEKTRARDPNIAGIPNGGFEQGGAGWSTVNPDRCRIVNDTMVSGTAAAYVSCSATESGARWEGELPVKPGGFYAIGAHAKTQDLSGDGYGYLAVYQYDAQGQLLRFIDFAQFWKSLDWKRYEQCIEIHPRATKVMFYGGLYLASGSLWFDDVTCGELHPQSAINAHFGKAEDGLVNTPDQLPLFSPDQRFQGHSLFFSPDAPFEMDWNSSEPVAGFEATAQLRQDARWLPLINAQDEWGQFSGAAGAFVAHYKGPYAGSCWALLGVENRDIFAGEAGKQLLRAVLRQLRRGVFALPLETDYAYYNQNEEIHLRYPIQNTSHEAQSLQLELRFESPGDPGEPIASITRSIVIPALSTQTEEFSWSIPRNAPDFIKVTGIIRVENEKIDQVHTGFCVANQAVIANGPRLRYSDNAYHVSHADGTTQQVSLWGTDTYGNYFFSPSYSPWDWFQELQMMQDGGLHLFENLQWNPQQRPFQEKHWRQLDGLIQLSQRFDLAYMAGLFIGQNVVTDDEELQAQAEFCRQFAARYKHVPGLIYYLNGDFQLRLKDTPDIRRRWNEFLQNRYSSIDKLRKSWNADVPDFGEIPVAEAPVQSGYNRRTGDMTAFKIQLMQRWIEALCQAIRTEDTQHPITSEYYQKPFSGMDLRLTLGSMDSANFGYFDRPQWDIARLMAVIKWNDMRRYGKTINMGEFGVKTHEAWSVERGGSHYHIQRTEREQQELFWWVAHVAWGMGVTKIQNWCWSDDADRVFPWGVVWNNPLRAKPVMKLYRNLRLLTDQMPVEYHASSTIFVMPDHWRLGVPENLSYPALLNALECLLAAQPDFDTVSESNLDFLDTETPQWIIAPLAYAYSDEALHQLQKAVQRGAHLYLSGDISLRPDGERDPSRLQWLCGVRGQGDVQDPSAFPVADVVSSGAEVMHNPAGIPLFQHTVGQGRVIYSPHPWEFLPNTDIFVENPETTRSQKTNLYLALFPESSVTATAGVWRSTETKTGDNTWVAIYPRKAIPETAQVTVRSSRAICQFTVHESIPCGVLLNPQGNPIAATGSGNLVIEGETIVACDRPWMILSLDGKAIQQSQRLVLWSMDQTQIQWKSETQDLLVEMADWKDGQPNTITAIPLTRTSQMNQVTVSPHELYYVKGFIR